jgi:hypothetical protein
MARPRAQVEEPQGLVYRPHLLSEEEEQALLGHLEGLEFHAVVMRGQTARRTVRHSIPAARTLRYSITFRTVPDPARWSG